MVQEKVKNGVDSTKSQWMEEEDYTEFSAIKAAIKTSRQAVPNEKIIIPIH